MRKLMVACVVAAGAVIGVAGEAGASEPVVQACIGATFSEAAHALHEAGAPPGSLGEIVSDFAQQPDGHPGLREGIQAIQAGLVPDSVAVNACHD